MLYTIFDLETTGLSQYTDDVCQFAALTVNERLTPVRHQNYYFYREGMKWSEEAERVHGLSRSFLQQYEKDFEHNLRAMYATLQYGNLVGHNSDSFDAPFVRNYIMRCGLPELTPSSRYDTMKIWWKPMSKKMKLTALTEQLGYSVPVVEAMTKALFPENASRVAAHNACYDVVATWLCFKAAVQKGYVQLSNTPMVGTGAAALSI